MLKYKIIFFVPYFGHFNNYFQWWLESCGQNPSINWVLLTDDERHFDYPTNVTKVQTTLNQVRKDIEHMLGFKVSLEKPFKLCDFRPAFGWLFQNYLKGYDFGGYCDTDLIWGDMRKFLTDEILNNYAKIGRHGHCVLIKNEKRCNEAFMAEYDDIPSYREVFQSPLAYCFDEWKGINRLFERQNLPVYWEPTYIDIDTRYWNFRPSGSLIGGENSGMLNGVANYKDGCLIIHWHISDGMKERELFYLHLQKRCISIETERKDRYSIVPNRLIPIQECWDNDTVGRIAPMKTFYSDYWKRRIRYILGKITKTNIPEFYNWKIK